MGNIVPSVRAFKSCLRSSNKASIHIQVFPCLVILLWWYLLEYLFFPPLLLLLTFSDKKLDEEASEVLTVAVKVRVGRVAWMLEQSPWALHGINYRWVWVEQPSYHLLSGASSSMTSMPHLTATYPAKYSSFMATFSVSHLNSFSSVCYSLPHPWRDCRVQQCYRILC